MLSYVCIKYWQNVLSRIVLFPLLAFTRSLCERGSVLFLFRACQIKFLSTMLKNRNDWRNITLENASIHVRVLSSSMAILSSISSPGFYFYFQENLSFVSVVSLLQLWVVEWLKWYICGKAKFEPEKPGQIRATYFLSLQRKKVCWVFFWAACCFKSAFENWLKFIFLLSGFITEKKTSLSAPQLRVEHFSLYLLRVTLPLTCGASAESNLGRHFVLVTSAFSVESGEHRVFLQVWKGRKISGSEWEQDVFLCVCVFVCVCVCVCVRTVHSGWQPISNQTNRKQQHPGEEAGRHVARRRESTHTHPIKAHLVFSSCSSSSVLTPSQNHLSFFHRLQEISAKPE